MTTAVDDWLVKKFPKDTKKTLINYIESLYPNAKTAAEIKEIVDQSDAQLKALYLIGLSRKTIQNTNLRNANPGPLFSTLNADDFNGTTQRVQTVAANNSITVFPYPKTLYANEPDNLKDAVNSVVALLGKPEPGSLEKYAGRIGATYGLDTSKIEENVYRFAFLQQPLELVSSKQNKKAVNELLFLIKGVKDFPKPVHNYIVDAFRKTGGAFDIKNQPIVVDLVEEDMPSSTTTTMQEPPPASEQIKISEQLAKEAMERLGKEQTKDIPPKPLVKEEKKPAGPTESEQKLTAQVEEKDSEIEKLKTQTRTLTEKAKDLEEKLAATEGETKKSLENATNQLKDVQKSANECLQQLKNATGDKNTVQKEVESVREKLSQNQTALTECQKQVQAAASKSSQACAAQLNLLNTQLQQRTGELETTQKQLKMCQLDSTVLMSDKKAEEKKLQTKIAELEQTRSSGLTSLETTKKERLQLEAKLSSALANLRRIEQLKRKCNDQGKTLDQKLGESTAKKLAAAEDASKIAQQNFETILSEINAQIATISNQVSNAYENECHFREELTALQQQKAMQSDKELQLQKEVDAKTQLVEQLRMQLQSSQTETATNSAMFADVNATVEELKKNLQQYEVAKKVAGEKLSDLQKQVKALMQETKDLVLKNNDCEAKYVAIEQGAVFKTRQLEQKRADDKKAFTQQIETLSTENARLKEELKVTKTEKADSEALKKKLAKCEYTRNETVTALTNREKELIEIEQRQKESEDALREAEEKNHEEFLDNVARMIGVAEIDADPERFARMLERFDAKDRDEIKKRLEKLRAEGAIPKVTGSSSRALQLQQQVDQLKNQLKDAQEAASRTSDERETLSAELAKAMEAVAVCESQQRAAVAEQLDETKLAELEKQLQALTQERDQLRAQCDKKGASVNALTEKIRNLEAAQLTGDEELQKCKQRRDDLLKTLEESDNKWTAQMRQLQRNFDDASLQLQAAPKVDDAMLASMQSRESNLRKALQESNQHLKDLQTEVELLLKNKNTFDADKKELEKKLQIEVNRAAKATEQLQKSQTNVELVNKKLLEMDTEQSKLKATREKCVDDMTKLKEDAQNELQARLNEIKLYRDQLSQHKIQSETDRKEKEALETKLNDCIRETNQLTTFLKPAQDEITSLREQLAQK